MDCLNCKDAFTPINLDRLFAYTMCDECYEDYEDMEKLRESKAQLQTVVEQKTNYLEWLDEKSPMFRLYHAIQRYAVFSPVTTSSLTLSKEDWSAIASSIEALLGLKSGEFWANDN